MYQSCTVHKTNIDVSTVSQYCTVCTLHSTVSQYRKLSTTVPDIINVNNHVNVNCDPTATTITHALYFNKCFFATPSFGDNSTSTTILLSFFRFFITFLVSLPGSDNNNVSNNSVTRVVVNIFTTYNNSNIATTTTTKTHCPLVKPILGLGGVTKKFSSVSATFWCVTMKFPSVSATFWCPNLGGVMMVFIPMITYFRWSIFGNLFQVVNFGGCISGIYTKFHSLSHSFSPGFSISNNFSPGHFSTGQN